MKRWFNSLLFICGLAAYFLPPAGWAGEVLLENGDRLSGKILTLEAGKLELETSHSGILRIDWRAVDCIRSDQPLEFVNEQNERISGKTECLPDRRLEIRPVDSGKAVQISITELKSINPPPDPRYRGALTAGASAASGNTDSRAAFGSGSLEIRSKRHRFTLNAKANYAESDSEVTARNLSGSGKYDYFFREKVFAYGQTLQEQDKLQDLNLRSTYGAGIGYQFFDSGRLSLFGETGLSYVIEDYDTADDRSYSSGRWAVGLKWAIVPDRITFFHSHEGYVSLDDTEDVYFKSEQGFHLPLIHDFFCNIQLDYDYKNKPAPGKKKADMRYFLGAGYEFSN